MDQRFAQHLIEKTLSDYNSIAERFSNTRSFVWKDLEFVRQLCSPQDKILDLGCGNGRLLELFKGLDIDYVGVDGSEKLIEIAKKKYLQAKFQKANVLNLPFKDNYFDKVFCIAVFHHIPSQELRIRFLKEIKRVLKPNGVLVLSVWSLWQKRFIKYHLKCFFLKILGKSRLDFRDIFYPWKDEKGKVLIQRYIHGFTKRELKSLLRKTDFTIKEIRKEKENIYLAVFNQKNK
jgi:ubiquinone/menaquinone biosynthesis C-methylase UbiE